MPINVLAATFALSATFQYPVDLDAEFDVALGTAGLTTRTARFDPNLRRFFGTGEFTSPFYTACDENPWRIPFFARTLRTDFQTQAGNPAASASRLASLLGFGTRRTLIGDPIEAAETAAKEPGALKKILDEWKALGTVRSEIPSLTLVPPQVQEAAALILGVLPSALEYRRLAVDKIADVQKAYELVVAGAGENSRAQFSLLELYRRFDPSYMGAGAHDLTLAVQKAEALLVGISDQADYDFRLDTAWGEIRLSGKQDSTYGEKPALLIIDTGGNDTYLNLPSTASAINWASIVIDSFGNENYLSDPALAALEVSKWEFRNSGGNKPGPGGAVFGVTLLVDSSGEDVYRTHRPGLASARMGYSALLDKRGSDRYEAYHDSQGFAQFGVALLEDLAGDDRYEGFSQVQGVGLTMGAGMVLDRAGDDRYIANDTTIDFPSPQSADHNVSMAQGAGYGLRADITDNHSLSGGVGILFDIEGDDGYQCGVFGQGVGYWEGVGMLWDNAGKDVYLGQWYVQGASAHFAIGYLEDISGNDTYTAPMNMAQGAGHDFSVGMHIDWMGDDQRRAPNLSLGAGNANGIGVFVDFLGTDTYEASGITIGKAAEAVATSLRATGICLGVFMDLAGNDSYPASVAHAKNGQRVPNWTAKRPQAAESQVGTFWDR